MRHVTHREDRRHPPAQKPAAPADSTAFTTELAVTVLPGGMYMNELRAPTKLVEALNGVPYPKVL